MSDRNKHDYSSKYNDGLKINLNLSLILSYFLIGTDFSIIHIAINQYSIHWFYVSHYNPQNNL